MISAMHETPRSDRPLKGSPNIGPIKSASDVKRVLMPRPRSSHQHVLGGALAYAGQEQHRAIRYCSLSLQLMDEFLELSAGGRGLFDGRQSVEDEEARSTRLDFTAQQAEDRPEAFLFEHTKGADVIEAIRDDFFFEKAELPDMKQHPRMVLGQQCYIERTATLGGMVEADLVAEDCLPCPGEPWT
jgi:hypothetical protein